MKFRNVESNTSSVPRIVRDGSDSAADFRKLGWGGLLIATGFCLFVLWESGIPISVFHLGGAKGHIDRPAFVATKYTYTYLPVPADATPKERLRIYYVNLRDRLRKKKPSAAFHTPSPVHAYNIQALLNDCMEQSGKRYLIAREALGVVYFGQTNELNAAQWVAMVEQVLGDHGLLLFSNRGGVVKVIPKAKLQDYRKAGLLKETDGPT